MWASLLDANFFRWPVPAITDTRIAKLASGIGQAARVRARAVREAGVHGCRHFEYPEKAL